MGNGVSFGGLNYFDHIFVRVIFITALNWAVKYRVHSSTVLPSMIFIECGHHYHYFLQQIIDNSLNDSGEWWCNIVCFSNHFRFYNVYQGILRNMHFKRLWSIMYFNHHSNWKEVYVVDSSPLFETLNAVYSSALNTWSRLESHSGCLSDWAIIKLDNSQQISHYAYFYTTYS